MVPGPKPKWVELRKDSRITGEAGTCTGPPVRPAALPDSTGPATATTTRCGSAGLRPQGAACSPAAQARPRLDSRALPRVLPARYRPRLASRRSAPRRPRGAPHISGGDGPREAATQGGRPSAPPSPRLRAPQPRSRGVRTAGALRSAPLRPPAPVPHASGRQPSSVRGGDNRASRAPPGSGPGPAPPARSAPLDPGRRAQPQFRPGLGAPRTRGQGRQTLFGLNLTRVSTVSSCSGNIPPLRHQLSSGAVSRPARSALGILNLMQPHSQEKGCCLLSVRCVNRHPFSACHPANKTSRKLTWLFCHWASGRFVILQHNKPYYSEHLHQFHMNLLLKLLPQDKLATVRLPEQKIRTDMADTWPTTLQKDCVFPLSITDH